VLNAAAAIAARDGPSGDLSAALRSGMQRAAHSIDSGSAAATLDRWLATAQAAKVDE
jgi:anthranilate phosphoribosyltransferase